MEDSDTQFSKEVTIVAYSNGEGNETDREFADRLVSLDMLQKTTRENRKVKFEFDLGRGDEEKKIYGHQFTDEVLEEAKEDLANSRFVSINDVRKTEEVYELPLQHAREELKDKLAFMLPTELSGGLEYTYLGLPTWEYEDNPEYKVKFANSDFTQKRILSKESKREDDDLYETMAEHNCFTLRVDMVSPNEHRLGQWTDEVITGLVKALRKLEAVGKVRFMACQVEETREGECYNI